MLIRLEPESSQGLADQIAAQVRGAIADGTLQAGEKLPPARELASGLDVNMHTVLRAYADLRDEGLIDLRRGRGAHVHSGESMPMAAQLQQQIRDLVANATRMGLSTEQLIDEIQKATT